MPTKRITLFETHVWRKISPLGTCTHVPWCGDPMVWNGHLLPELTDASLRLIASDSVMTLIWLLYYLNALTAVVLELGLLNFTHICLFHLTQSTENSLKNTFAPFCICSRTGNSREQRYSTKVFKGTLKAQFLKECLCPSFPPHYRC